MNILDEFHLLEEVSNVHIHHKYLNGILVSLIGCVVTSTINSTILVVYKYHRFIYFQVMIGFLAMNM
jgi:hypothetical protein